MTSGLAFRLERHEQVAATPSTTLVRVSGVWTAPEVVLLDEPELEVTCMCEHKRFAALPDPAGRPPEASPGGGSWRGVFAVPRDVLDRATTLRLVAGGAPHAILDDEALDARTSPVEASANGRKSGLVWAMSVPILLFEIGQAVIHATDTALLARVGTAQLAAIVLADIMRGVWIMPVAGLTEAAQIVIARRFGEGRRRAVGATLTRSMLAALALGLVLAVALWASAEVLASWVATSSRVGDALGQYLRVAAWGLPFESLALACSSLYVGVGRTRPLIGAAAALTTVNLAASWIFIFGTFGLPRLGIAGAAWGFVLAQACMLAWLMVALRSQALAPYGTFRLHATHIPGLRALARLGAPVSGQGLLEYGRWFAFFIILEHAGEEILAWSNLVYACVALLVIPTFAFSESTYTLVSRMIGMGHADQIGDVVRRTAVPALLLTLPFVVVIVVAPGLVLQVFTNDPAAVEGAADALRIVGLAFFIVVPAQMWVAALFGTGDTDVALGIEVLTGAAMLVSAWLAALVLDLSLAWIWVSLALASAMSMPLARMWVRSGRWQRKVV